MSSQRRIVFKLNRETHLPRKVIQEAPSSGPFDDYAEYLLKLYNVEVTLGDSIEYLRRFGAWENPELQDIELNKARLLWLACLDCKENKTVYFYMGE